MKSLNGRAKPVHDSKLVCSSNEGDNLFKMVRLIWCITRDDTNPSASFLCASQRIGTSRGPSSASLFFFSFMLCVKNVLFSNNRFLF